MRFPKKTSVIAACLASMLLAAPVLAAPDLGFGYAESLGLPQTDIRTVVANVVRSLMGLLGIWLVLQIMWGGFLMMTHGGNEEKRTEAISVIRNSIIGMVIIMSSASIAKFVVDAIANAASGNIM
ncbi:MAG TPA: pilin [Candidatus Eisenbacteria bacterium]|jgi:hypothetical protein|nr:pilin [Candidatus Eisenbacteria bacterium]